MTGRERMAVFGVLLWLAGCAATPETGGSAVPRDPDRASVLARRGDLDWQAACGQAVHQDHGWLPSASHQPVLRSEG